jgi:hypothetical protein
VTPRSVRNIVRPCLKKRKKKKKQRERERKNCALNKIPSFEDKHEQTLPKNS